MTFEQLVDPANVFHHRPCGTPVVFKFLYGTDYEIRCENCNRGWNTTRLVNWTDDQLEIRFEFKSKALAREELSLVVKEGEHGGRYMSLVPSKDAHKYEKHKF